MEVNHNRMEAARQQLRLLAQDRARLEAQARYHVRNAFTYGLTVAQIAAEARMPSSMVRQLLLS